MTETEIIEANKVIAEFDGFEFRENGDFIELWKNSCVLFMETRRYLDKYLLHNLSYHSNWNLIMKAWYSFKDLKIPDISAQLKHSELKTTVGYAILYGNIKLAHQNLYEAIQWYNTQSIN